MSYQSTLAMLHYPEIFLILVVVLIMFGAKKLPELARGLGQGIKEFKNATSDIRNDIEHSLDAPPSPPREPVDHR
ncbi:MAG: Sec-independent protein translocase subunit TatA/TatB [Verrucomicrobiia bacterium]|jgi:sec-independent protein translocase protein TatA